MKPGRKGRLPAAELLAGLKDPKARAAVEAQLEHRHGVMCDVRCPVADRDTKPANVLPKPVKDDPYRSNAERTYAAWLESGGAGHGNAWSYERVSVTCEGKGTRYKPDFIRWCPTLGAFVAIEVKGTVKKTGRPFYREGARRRVLDGAGALHRFLGLELWVAWRVDGVWQHERVPTRPS